MPKSARRAKRRRRDGIYIERGCRDERMAVVGSLHPQPARARAQTRRQPPRRAEMAIKNARDVYTRGATKASASGRCGPRHRRQLAGDKDRCSSRRNRRSIGIRRFFRCPTKSSTSEHERPANAVRIPVAACRQRLGPGAAPWRMGRPRAGAGGRHRDDQRGPRSARPVAPLVRLRGRSRARFNDGQDEARTSPRSCATPANSEPDAGRAAERRLCDDDGAAVLLDVAQLSLARLDGGGRCAIAEIAAKALKEVRTTASAAPTG